MKKYFLTALITLAALTANAQSRGIKIAYIDMEYILDKVPDYAEAKNQLELKASKWKQELEVKRNDISALKASLQAEKALLTKELIEEREEEIAYLEKDLIDYQEKRFGPMGDLVTQKAVLVKPIQDQVFTVVQDLAALRNYDFVFDKSSDLTMLFSAKKHDISDLVIKRLSRAAKQEQLSSKELKRLEEEEAKEERESDPAYAERQKAIEDKKASREKKLEERKAAQEEKKRLFEEKREQQKQERDAKRAGTTSTSSNTTTTDNADGADRPASSAARINQQQEGDETIEGDNTTEVKTTATETPEAGTDKAVDRQNAAQAAREERERKIEERKKEIEEKKKKAAEQREAAKKAKEDKKNSQPDTPAPPTEGEVVPDASTPETQD